MFTSRKIKDLTYQVGGLDLIPKIKPLWLELREHHARLSRHFSRELHHLQFEERIPKLMAEVKDDLVRIELVFPRGKNVPIAYSLSTVKVDGRGELDNLYVTRRWRGKGLGNLLVEHSVRWLQERRADPLEISVIVGNEQAAHLYKRLGFEAREVIFQERSLPDNEDSKE